MDLRWGHVRSHKQTNKHPDTRAKFIYGCLCYYLNHNLSQTRLTVIFLFSIPQLQGFLM